MILDHPNPLQIHMSANLRVKLAHMASVWAAKGWQIVILTDVAWKEQGIWEYETVNGKWTIVNTGRIAFAMDNVAGKRWRDGGSIWKKGRKDTSGQIRCASITIPRIGWRRGMHIVGVYITISLM